VIKSSKHLQPQLWNLPLALDPEWNIYENSLQASVLQREEGVCYNVTNDHLFNGKKRIIFCLMTDENNETLSNDK
jgi:hypothetical protein